VKRRPADQADEGIGGGRAAFTASIRAKIITPDRGET
jgi:hypothetical protein